MQYSLYCILLYKHILQVWDMYADLVYLSDNFIKMKSFISHER